jgi:cell division protein FtsB
MTPQIRLSLDDAFGNLAKSARAIQANADIHDTLRESVAVVQEALTAGRAAQEETKALISENIVLKERVATLEEENKNLLAPLADASSGKPQDVET